MSRVVLYGDDAIRYAENHHIAVHLREDRDEEASTDFGHARELAADNPRDVWVEIEGNVNTGKDGEGPRGG